MFANGGIRVPARIRILSVLLLVFTGVIGAIEVHEDVNEGPIVSARLNVSSSSSGNGAATLLTTKLPPLVNERNVNDPGSPASQHHHQHQQYQQQQQQQSSIDEPAHNFTTFPSNHRQQHTMADHGNRDDDGPSTTTTTSVESVAAPSSPAAPSSSSTTSRALPEGPAGPVTPSTAITTAAQPPVAHHTPAGSPSAIGLAAFRATSNSNSQFKSPSIAKDRSRIRTVQHQISGYRKRQLYASATQPRNANGSTAGNESGSDQSSSIEAPFSRDFVPSPEVGVYYGDESSPMVPIQPPVAPGTTRASQAPRTVIAVEHGGFVPHAITPAVDALYPTAHGSYGGDGTTAGDSRWYTGTRGYQQQQQLKTSAIPTTVKWEHKYPAMWSHQQSQQPQHTNSVKFPQEEVVTSQTTSQFPTPKGKWKWIPEEDAGGESAKAERPGGDSGVTFSSAGGGTIGTTSSEESSSLRQQPAVVTLSRPSTVYTFERIPSSVEVPVLGGTPFSSEGISGIGGAVAGGNSSTAEVTGGGTSKDVLIGKEELHHKSGTMSPWKKIIHVLTAAIPIGLLISALTPQVVYINPNATLPPQSVQLQTPSPVSGAGLSSGGLRQRSLDATGVSDPIGAIQLFQKLMALERDAEQVAVTGGDNDVSNRLMNAAVRGGATTTANRLQHCDWMLLCQLVHQRQSPESVAVRRMLWKMANETPPEWVRQLGLDQILRSIRDGDCGQLQRTCHRHEQDT